MSARNQKLRDPAAGGRRAGASKKVAAPKNARFPERDRKVRLQSRNVAYQPTAPLVIPITWLNTVIGLMLLPVVWVTTQTFFTLLSRSAAQAEVWRTPQVVLFGWGLVVWLAAFWAGLRPRYVYVLGHELTHALFVLLCGGRIHEFRVTADGGHVITDKNNLMISLSPYFVPFWSLVAVTVYGLCGVGFDLDSVQRLRLGEWRFSLGMDAALACILGYTWGLHLTFTLWMVTRDQPDLRQNGTFFSLVFIYFINLVLIVSLFVLASPGLGAGDLMEAWLDHLKALARWAAALG
jgi:hypothetical protein